MKVVIFGATGMIGHGATTECLEDPGVEEVLLVVRRPTGRSHPKLKELIRSDFSSFEDAAEALTGYDACLFTLGISAAGLDEAEYRRITRDIAVAAATVLVRQNPGMSFIFISGAGTDASSSQMWARVKAEAERDLAALPFPTMVSMRPGYIQPVKGAVSATPAYRFLYAVLGPLYPLFKAVFPASLLTSETLGRAMLAAARRPGTRAVLEAAEINALLGASGA